MLLVNFSTQITRFLFDFTTELCSMDRYFDSAFWSSFHPNHAISARFQRGDSQYGPQFQVVKRRALNKLRASSAAGPLSGLQDPTQYLSLLLSQLNAAPAEIAFDHLGGAHLRSLLFSIGFRVAF